MKALLLVLALAARGADWDARVVSVEGEARLFAAGSSAPSPAEADSPLEAGDRIETGADGQVEVALGRDNLLQVGPGSSLTLSSLSEADAGLGLEAGSLLAKIAKLVAGGALRVRTPQAVAAVRGTEFAVESGAEGTHVGVFDEGRVALTSVEDSSVPEAVLGPGQEASLAPGMFASLPPGARRLIAVRRLERLAARRERMKAFRARLARHRQRWKKLDPARRQELRRRLLEGRGRRIERIREEIRRRDGEAPRRRPQPRRRREGRP